MTAGNKLNVALMGTRGIPANYGGFETFAEELSCRGGRAILGEPLGREVAAAPPRQRPGPPESGRRS